MKNFTDLKKNLKKNFSDLITIKIAVLGDNATQLLTQALKGLGFEYEYNLEIFEADYNQIERQVYDQSSDLYQFKPEIVIIFKSSNKLLLKYNKSNPEDYTSFASNELEILQSLYATINNNIETNIILYNHAEIDDAIFGSFSNKQESSFLFQLRKLNYELMLLSTRNSNLFICDLSSIQNQIGRSFFFQPSIYVNTDMVLTIDVLPYVAQRTLDIIRSLKGKIKKCIIIDLDNTTWGGVIGDDGLHNIQLGDLGIGKAFTDFQYWIKKLKNRGIIVAVCSKNTESIAKEPFVKHPEMILRLEDISVFKANWNNKADNIREIQSILNIGFDSMVFLDDNPFERNMVRENIDEIYVPELPEDPSNYLEFLYSLNLFETSSYSEEDKERTKLYQIEAKREQVYKNFTNVDDFLRNLEMKSKIEPFNKFNTPRVAQLSQRSNQFNLRTIRYTESDISRMSNSNEFETFAFSLEDRFGDNGLICVVILKKENKTTLFIDTWFMSCRVLKRGMENFVMNILVEFAIDNGFNKIIGEYIPTSKNEMVKEHYIDLGFEKYQNQFLLNINKYKKLKTFIKK